MPSYIYWQVMAFYTSEINTELSVCSKSLVSLKAVCSVYQCKREWDRHFSSPGCPSCTPIIMVLPCSLSSPHFMRHNCLRQSWKLSEKKELYQVSLYHVFRNISVFHAQVTQWLSVVPLLIYTAVRGELGCYYLLSLPNLTDARNMCA